MVTKLLTPKVCNFCLICLICLICLKRLKLLKRVKTIKKSQNVPVEFVATMYIRNKKACTVDRFRAFIPYRYYQNQYCCTREYGQPQPTVHSTTVRTVIQHYYSIVLYLLLYQVQWDLLFYHSIIPL